MSLLLQQDERFPATSAGSPPAARRVASAPYFRYCGFLNRIAAALLLVPGLPVMLLTILAVRLTSRGPGVYKQTRVGLSGRKFVMYKIRTMRVDAEADSGPVWTKKGDTRITWLGKRIRALHLDEFPQLFNVLKGEMALIGPRPERPEFTLHLARQIPGYLDRLSVLPGITGLAQINLPPDEDLDSVRRKLVLDLEYVKTGSLSLDLRIIFSTFIRLVGIKGLFASQILGLLRDPEELDPSLANVDGKAAPHPVASANGSPAPTNGATLNGHHAAEQNGHNGHHNGHAADVTGNGHHTTNGRHAEIERALNRRPSA